MNLSQYQTIIYFFVLIILIIYLALSIFAIFSFPKDISQTSFNKDVTINGNLTADDGDFSSITSNTVTTNDINPLPERDVNNLLNINLSGTTAMGNLQIEGDFNPQNINATSDVTSNNGSVSLNNVAILTNQNSLNIETLTTQTVTNTTDIGSLTDSLGAVIIQTQTNTTDIGTLTTQTQTNTTDIGTLTTQTQTNTTDIENINISKLSLSGGELTGTLSGTNLSLSGDINANRITAAAQLGIAILTQTQISELTENQLGDIIFNSTTNLPMYYNGTSYQEFSTGGGSFDPTLTNVVTGDSLYFNGSVWKNGYYMSPPTLSYASPFTINFSNFITPFYWNSTSANMKIYLKIYSNPELTNIVVDINLVGNSWTGTSSQLQYDTTYYATGQYENILYPNSLSAVSSSLTFTTPESDLIAQQLTTSLAAYEAAPSNSAVNITETEYNNILANVTGNSISGNTNPFVNGATAPLSDEAVTSNILSPFPANSYLIAYSYMSYGTGSSSGYFALANNQVISSSSPVYPWVTSADEIENGIYYYCIKAPPNPLSENFSLFPIVLSNSEIPFVVGNVTVLRFYNSPLPTYTPGQTVFLNQTDNSAGLLNVSFVSTPDKNW